MYHDSVLYDYNIHNNTRYQYYEYEFTQLLMFIILFVLCAGLCKKICISLPTINRYICCCRRSVPIISGEVVEDTGENGELIITTGVHI